MYAIITPDDSGEYDVHTTTSSSAETPACPVGQWVTVTRENGVVPSMSVTWRRLQHFVASWQSNASRNAEAAQAPSFDATTRQAGVARLQAGFQSPREPALQTEEDWMPRARSFVSR